MTRYQQTTGCGTSYVRESWRDNTTYCARQQKFGAVRELAEEARAAGEPSWIVGVAITSAIFSILAIGWVMT